MNGMLRKHSNKDWGKNIIYFPEITAIYQFDVQCGAKVGLQL